MSRSNSRGLRWRDRWPSAHTLAHGKDGGKGPYINRITIAGLTPVTLMLTVAGQARTRSRMRAWWWGGRKGGAYKAREGYWEYVTRILGRIRVPVTRTPLATFQMLLCLKKWFKNLTVMMTRILSHNHHPDAVTTITAATA